MKLAEALQLRTTITEAITRLPQPTNLNSSVIQSRAVAAGYQTKVVGQAKPLTDTKSWRIKPEEGLQDYIAALPACKPIMEFDVEAQQMVRQLEALDALIQEANFSNKNAWPGQLPAEPGDVAGVKKSLSAFLLRRKTYKDRAKRLEQYLAVIPQKPALARTKVNDTLENLEAVYPLVDLAEARQAHNRTMQSLRVIDNHIQQANWAINVPVPAWVKTGFITEAVNPVSDDPKALVVATPTPELATSTTSPVAPMLAVPELKTKKASVPTLKPAGEASPIFVPPSLGIEPDTDEDVGGAGWTAE
jgi:hypothetical protein